MEKVKIFNYPWHIAHQFELMRIPNTKWDWLIQYKRGYSAFPRGDYFNELDGTWVSEYEEGKYDFALLHLDQQCFEPNIMEMGKGRLFQEMKEVVKDVPKVCIMHGTPYYPEMFESDITEENYKELGYTKDQIKMSSKLINSFIEETKDFHTIVFNSHTAQKQWSSHLEGKDGYPKYKTIWHGMDEEEWYSLPKEPRVVTMISPAGLDAYYDRTLLRRVKEELLEKGIEHCHITVDAVFKNWEEYRQFLGRSLIYFNPTKESPMPRSRTEALFSGCCVLSIGGQDVEDFITDGENGIIVPRSPKVIANLIETLIFDYKKALEIGEKGREMAKETFSIDKFHQEWSVIIKDITGKEIM